MGSNTQSFPAIGGVIHDQPGHGACVHARVGGRTAPGPQEPPTGDRAVYRVPVTGVIELGLAPFIERSLREAEAAGAVAVILDIRHPGRTGRRG